MINDWDRTYTFQDAVRELARRACETEGHQFHDVTQGIEPVSIFCARDCGHLGWQLVARAAPPQLRDQRELFTLEQAQLELARLECARHGHVLQEYAGDHRRGERELQSVSCCRCDHPGWLANRVACADHAIAPTPSDVLPCAGVTSDG